MFFTVMDLSNSYLYISLRHQEYGIKWVVAYVRVEEKFSERDEVR